MTLCFNIIDGISTAAARFNYRWLLELRFRQGQVKNARDYAKFDTEDACNEDNEGKWHKLLS